MDVLQRVHAQDVATALIAMPKSGAVDGHRVRIRQKMAALPRLCRLLWAAVS